MDEPLKKAFDFAADITKQLITLSTGVVALTITFQKDFLRKGPGTSMPWAIVAWAAFLFSIVCGLWTLMALTGTLDQDKTAIPMCTRGANVRVPSILQIVSFLTGLLFTIIFGGLALQ